MGELGAHIGTMVKNLKPQFLFIPFKHPKPKWGS
jgi:hypothetical protein